MLPLLAWRPVAIVGAAVATVLTVASPRYGFHRDELYFIVAGRHLAVGYVDQPPLTPLLARVSTELFGVTPAGARVPATLMTVALVVVVALVARELGGAAVVQTLAAGCAATATYVLAVGHMLSTATVDLLAWTVTCWLFLRLLRTGDGRWWVGVGLVVGIGVWNKYLIGLLVVSLAVGLLVVGPREVLRSRWLAVGIALGLAVAAPNLVWQATHGWPQLTVAAGISADDGVANRIGFVPEQLLYLSPGFVPVWLAGLVRFFRDPALRRVRAVAVAYLVACVLVLVLGGKSYYVLPLLLVFLAAGVRPVVSWLSRGRRLLRSGLAAVVAASTLASTAVIALPVLPVSALDDPGVLSANKEPGEQAGWPELVDTVAQGWREIPRRQRGDAVLVTSNYGEAGAIWLLGGERGLPRPYSGHMSFADWRRPPDSATGPVLLVHPGDGDQMRRQFVGCREVARHRDPDGADNEEQGTEVVLCQRPAEPWSRLWPKLRHYY